MNFFDKKADLGIYYNHLPHWRQTTVCYFVTFRTADSLPQAKLIQWKQERDKWQQQHPQPRTDEQNSEYHKLFSNRIEHWLDQNYGECLLANQQYKQIVIDALLFFNDVRYRIWEYTVAANHVHLLIEPLEDYRLDKIIQSIKSFTALKINKARGTKGHFWQHEYFDHILRSEDQLKRIVNYIRKHDTKVAATSCRKEEIVAATSCRKVDTTSCRIRKEKYQHQDDVSTIKHQDDASTIDVSTIKHQDDASTVDASTIDVSTIDVSTMEPPC